MVLTLMEKVYVDRIEGQIVVCVDEQGTIIEIKLNEIGGCVVEGSVLIKKNGKYLVDEAETKKRRAEISKLQNEIFDEN